MKSTLVFLIASGLASALNAGPAPTPAPAKRQLGLNGLNGISSEQDLINLAQQLGIDVGGQTLDTLGIGQLNCDILQLLALMGLGGSVDVLGLGLNFNQQIAMIAALEQLFQLQQSGFIGSNDVLDLLSNSIIGNIGSLDFSNQNLDVLLGNGLFNFGAFKRNLDQLKKEKRIPDTLPEVATPTRALRARGHGRKRQEECTLTLGTTTETTSFEEETEVATTTDEETTTTTDEEETTTTTDEEETTTTTDEEETTTTEEAEATETADEEKEEEATTTEEAGAEETENADEEEEEDAEEDSE